MAKFCGKDLLVQIEDSGNPGTFLDVGAIQSNSLSINHELIDVTDKGSGGWREGLVGCGILSMSCSGQGFVSDNAGFAELMTQHLARAACPLRITSGYGDQFEGDFQCTTLERGGEYNGAETLSVSFENLEAVTYTAPPP